MDPFTQRMLEKAEQRSKMLGISSATMFSTSEQRMAEDVFKKPGIPVERSPKKWSPLKHSNTTTMANKLDVIQKTVEAVGGRKEHLSSEKIRRHYAVGKENMDLGMEIDITTAKDVEIRVVVEEQDVKDNNSPPPPKEADETPTARIRETSRARLQRLGLLYSNSEISSPIHRTEGNFHEAVESNEISPKPPQQRSRKLAALADSINNWEDDIKTKSGKSPAENSVTTLDENKEVPNKPHVVEHLVKEKNPQNENVHFQKTPATRKLKWDQKVMDSLEAQGFQRRQSGANDSSATKLAYNYESLKQHQSAVQESKSMGDSKFPTSSTILTKPALKPVLPLEGGKLNTTEKTVIPPVRTGMVGGRTATFENKGQKDPTELSLKERMKLFEKNKGEALMPKAPFAMSPSITKINHDNKKVADTIAATKQAVEKYNKGVAATIPTVKNNAESQVRNKVAALVANASSTIAESRIKAEISRQRQEDMQVIANRFNKQKEHCQPSRIDDEYDDVPDDVGNQNANRDQCKNVNIAKSSSIVPPPPPPPQQTGIGVNNKRRSPGESIDDTKRARKSNVSACGGRLYPVLSDLESNESDIDNCTTATLSGEDDQRNANPLNRSFLESEEDSASGICDVSLGREILQVVCSNESQNNNPERRKEYFHIEKDSLIYGESSVNSSEECSGEMDDYLDEAFDDEDADEEENNDDTDGQNTEDRKPAKLSQGTTTSNSFSYKRVHCMPIAEEESESSQTVSSTPLRTPVTSALTVNQSEDENVVTLVHTVSIYRRQQNANSCNSTPVRKICREEQVVHSRDECGAENTRYPRNENSGQPGDDEFSSDEEDADERYLVEEKIKKLLDEVCKQQQVIGQTSRALNLCAATVEFSGSTESVEGERHLLVATHRRQGALDEIQRLRIEKTLRPVNAPREKGRLTVKEITIPLKSDYIRKLADDTISGHHLVCLLKYNEHVLATKTVPTLPGLSTVKFPDVLELNNVYADFRVTLEIYGMTAQREVLPHDIKYHINVNKKGGSKTPKKKRNDNQLIMPIVQSPAGPNVVRTPALVQYGFAIFSLREALRTTWSLTQLLGVSPLEGVVNMKINCELSVTVNHEGFLTMFEEISGFGAWHRRWCHLTGHVINYWKYPDDEKKKAPMGSIDLSQCSLTTVTTAPRDICARLNTMMLEFKRPARDDDTETLLIVPNGKTTTVRLLLSADTKTERELWCAFLNKTLTLLRAWGKQTSE